MIIEAAQQATREHRQLSEIMQKRYKQNDKFNMNTEITTKELNTNSGPEE